jgi:hypothetical protein
MCEKNAEGDKFELGVIIVTDFGKRFLNKDLKWENGHWKSAHIFPGNRLSVKEILENMPACECYVYEIAKTENERRITFQMIYTQQGILKVIPKENW